MAAKSTRSQSSSHIRGAHLPKLAHPRLILGPSGPGAGDDRGVDRQERIYDVSLQSLSVSQWGVGSSRLPFIVGLSAS